MIVIHYLRVTKLFFKKVFMALTIDLLLPSSITSYTEGSAGVSKIQVHYYFANVVDVIIHFTDLSQIRYYQVPCILHTPPPA